MAFEGIAMLFLLMYVSLNKLDAATYIRELSDLVTLRPLVTRSPLAALGHHSLRPSGY